MKKLNYLFILAIFLVYASCDENSSIETQDTLAYPTDGLVAYWTFDNDNIETIVDSSSNSLNGESYSVLSNEGIIGKSASFNGINSKIIFPEQGSLPPGIIGSLETGTISLWFKFINKEGQVLPILYFGRDDSSSPPYGLIIEIGHDMGDPNNRRLYFTIIHSSTENFCFDSGQNLEENKWYHFAAVVSSKGNTGYLNGSEITNRRYNLGSNENYSIFFNNVPTKEVFSIGYGRYSQEEPFYSFNGNIDNIMIYNRPLNVDEIMRLYEMGNSE
ncbi:MAG: hypothetical protein A2041_15250 [Bacteroidetes bacterium GWA2_31_9b]|nr:MAG: hypothetical protein A2041_15250 [Bacteroidetes bacterium GWA2_31_9b]